MSMAPLIPFCQPLDRLILFSLPYTSLRPRLHIFPELPTIPFPRSPFFRPSWFDRNLSLAYSYTFLFTVSTIPAPRHFVFLVPFQARDVKCPPLPLLLNPRACIIPSPSVFPPLSFPRHASRPSHLTVSPFSAFFDSLVTGPHQF